LCFDAIVTEGIFQAAAERLHRSQPTVSSSVKNLEVQLNLNKTGCSRCPVWIVDRSSGEVGRTA
jgi:hypothetical protein